LTSKLEKDEFFNEKIVNSNETIKNRCSLNKHMKSMMNVNLSSGRGNNGIRGLVTKEHSQMSLTSKKRSGQNQLNEEE
jgi:hypothetical protein